MGRFTDPIIGALKAMGVMFFNPTAGEKIAGIIFDENNDPTNIQAPDGSIKPFPGGGASGIPNPAPDNSEGNGLFLAAEPGVDIFIQPQDRPSDPPSSAAGSSIFLQAARGGLGDGGPGGSGGSVSVFAGDGNNGAGASGAGIEIGGAEGGVTDEDGGNLTLYVGGGIGTGGNGKLALAALGSDPFGVPPNAQNVTIGNVGPGGAPLTVTAWIPITIDDVDGYIPFFSA